MDITQNSIVGELVAQDYRTASVFKSHKIDFCCNGNRSIQEVSENPEELIAELENVSRKTGNETTDFQSWPLDLLTEYIEKKHHRYVELKNLEILPYLEKINSVHGHRHPELAEIQKLFRETSGEISMHMKKEEFLLFPYIRKMVKSKLEGALIAKPPFGTVENPIAMMMHDHDAEGERFRKIAALSNDYTPPSDACNTYRVTFALLQEYEDDLHQHIHLENNILFPKALELEKAIA